MCSLSENRSSFHQEITEEMRKALARQRSQRSIQRAHAAVTIQRHARRRGAKRWILAKRRAQATGRLGRSQILRTGRDTMDFLKDLLERCVGCVGLDGATPSAILASPRKALSPPPPQAPRSWATPTKKMPSRAIHPW
jgi:hypothetical protein